MIIFFAVLFIVGGLAVFIWIAFHEQLTNMLRWVRVGELWIIKLLYGNDVMVAVPGAGEQSTEVWRRYLQKAPANELDNKEVIVAMTRAAVPPLTTFFTVILGLMLPILFFFGPGTGYKRRMNLEGLMAEQARSFPAIAPFVKFDPRKLPSRVTGQPVPEQLPLFAEALSPEEWLAYHEIPVMGSKIDANKAYQALVPQLGKRWEGPLKLPLHAQALFAAFALKHVRKRKECETLLNQLALSWSPEKGFNLSLKVRRQIRAIIKDPKLGGALRKVADQHAFETTALLRALATARQEGGILAPAEFLWLRGHDRTLWYPFNNLGRKSYHAEAAGAMVHYTNELIAGQKIPQPRFDEVLKGYEAYLKSPSVRAIPEKIKGKKSA